MLDRSFSPDSTCPAIALATAELHPFFPNLLPAFIFLLCKKINAIQILKNISMHRYICHFLLTYPYWEQSFLLNYSSNARTLTPASAKSRMEVESML